MRILFADFTQQAEKKIEGVMLEGSDKQITKLLQRGEDCQFDQLLSALGSVAEHCLPSLLKALLAWHRRQISLSNETIKNDIKKCDLDWNLIKSNNDLEIQLQRREAAVEFIFCLALLEILKQLPFHPGHEDIIKNIENLAFRHFKYRDGIQTSPNSYNIHIIADLYGEVVGTLAYSRFASVSFYLNIIVCLLCKIAKFLRLTKYSLLILGSQTIHRRVKRAENKRSQSSHYTKYH